MTKEIPVTLLSGFLGSGKTTLLKHILENKSNLKCAVIVNDMAAINIDAALIKSSSSKFIQKEEQLVQLQNGCICCTLRGDLVQEIGRLARENGAELDYIVIESTGISEPMQVAETFALTQEELDGEKDGPVFAASPELQSLVGIARLDTCVSVVDTYNLLDYFEEAKFIGQKFQGVDKADERTVTDLLMDQLEFANVIILNKVETVKGSDKLQKCIALVKNLNPSAKIIQSSFCKVDLKDILNTKSFNMLEAQTSAGWLQSLKEEHVPETVEYGISSFVYRGRRPFHPERLYNLLKKSFFIIEPYFEEGGEEMGDGEQDGEDDEQDDEDEQEEQEIDQKEAEKRKRNKQKSVFCNVLRSKGFMWLATRYSYMSEWSQAGMILTVENGGNWFAEIDQSEWPEGSVEDIRKDFLCSGNVGQDAIVQDRRQEIVFIGQFDGKSSKSALIQKLDKCLLDDGEWNEFLSNGGSLSDDVVDPWEQWN